MTTLLWATDVHLDHLPSPIAAFEFGRWMHSEAPPDCLGMVVTGDIAEAASIERILQDLARGFAGPLYFVLGNHDFYGGTFADVVRAVDAVCRLVPNLHWLCRGTKEIANGVVLLGVDGWYDARYGDRNTTLQLTDFSRITDLFEAQDRSRDDLLAACARRADAEAARLARLLQEALSSDRSSDSGPREVREVIVGTHVPPFQAAAWHAGRCSDDHWAPFFSSKALGDVLEAAASAHPRTRFTVLCGHTHGSGVYQHRDNLVVYTGRARYGAPELAGLVTLDAGELHVELHPERGSR